MKLSIELLLSRRLPRDQRLMLQHLSHWNKRYRLGFVAVGILIFLGTIAVWKMISRGKSQNPVAKGVSPPLRPADRPNPWDRLPRAARPVFPSALIGRAPIDEKQDLVNWTIETIWPRGQVVAVCAPAQRSYFAVGTENGLVRLYDSRSRDLLKILIVGDGELEGMAISPDGKRLISMTKGQPARLWDVESGTPLPTKLPSGYNAASWSPNGKYLVWLKVIFNRPFGNSTQVVDCQTWDSVGQINGTFANWSPDGETLATFHTEFVEATSLHRKVIRFWSSRDATERKITLQSWPDFHPNENLSLEWSPDGRHLAFFIPNRHVHVWTYPSGEHIDVRKPRDNLFGDAMSWSRDSRILWLFGGLAGTQEVTTNADPATIRLQAIPEGYRSTQSPVWLQDPGTAILVRSDVEDPRVALHFWESGTQKISDTWEAFETRPIASFGVSPIGSVSPNGLAASVMQHRTGRCFVLDLVKNQVEMVTNGTFWPVAWSPDDTKLIQVEGKIGDPRRMLYVPATRSAIPLPVGSSQSWWSPDGKICVVDGSDGFHFLNGLTGEKYWDPIRFDEPVFRIHWSPDGRRFACIFANKIRLYDVTHQGLRERPSITEGVTPGTLSIISDNGERLAMITSAREVRIWHCDTRKHLLTIPIKEDTGSIAWSPSGARLAVGSRLETSIVEVPSGKQLQVFQQKKRPEKANSRKNRNPWENPFWCGENHVLVATCIDSFVRRIEPAIVDSMVLYDIGSGAEVHSCIVDAWGIMQWKNSEFILNATHSKAAEVIHMNMDSKKETQIRFTLLSENKLLLTTDDGHYRGPDGIERDLVYLVLNKNNSTTVLRPDAFATKYGWKNDPLRIPFPRR